MAWQRINQSIRKALEDVTLADLQHRRQPLPPPNLRAGLARAARRVADGLGRTNGNGFDRTSTTSSNAATGTASSPTSSRTRCRPGLDEDVIRLISRQEGRARVPDRVAAQGVSALAHARGADLGARPLPADRLPGHLVLLGAEDQRRRDRRASTRSTRSCSRPTTSSASRCTSARGSPASRSTPCSTACRSRPRSKTSSQTPA